MSDISRRSVLKGASGSLAALAFAGVATDRQVAYAASRSVFTKGTTLANVATPKASSGYARLTAGPGWALVVRDELVAAKPNRDDTRKALASIVQFTDLHMIDAQSPVRFEWLSTVNGSAFRPQEPLGSHGGAQLVKRINDLAKGPFSGRVFDCVVSTGDNTDNHESVELDWFLAVMNGGTIRQNTGAATEWEGVATGGDEQFYNVSDDAVRDRYKEAGFPTVPGFFARAVAPHRSHGLKTPWFSVFGNHDDSMSGVLPSDWAAVAKLYTSDKKFMGFKASTSNTQLRRAYTGASRTLPQTSSMTTRSVTPDARRAPFTPVEYMKAHLPSGGHGFTEENVATGRGYYAFRIADGVTGIAMDSTNRAGWTEGSLGDEQFRWLQRRLEAGSSRFFDVWGAEQKRQVDDELFVLLSHHTSESMNNLLLDPGKPEIRHGGLEVVNTLKRFPNVIAWVNGHTHVNSITARRHRDPERSFWEINTASHVDFPQLARIIEVCDNADGTLSLFTTLVESAAPYQASYSDGSQAALASLYRELSYNDINAEREGLGTQADRNTELLLPNPLH